MNLEKESYERIVENLHDGLYLVDRDRVITYWNKAAEKISGFTASEVTGRPCADSILTHIDDAGNNLCTATCPLAATMADGKAREAEIYMHHKNGHRVAVSVRTGILTDRDGKITGGIELFSDISNQEANRIRMKELEKLALLDKLTQLANRNCIEREIQNRFHDLRQLNIPFGILFMDIDHFKRFNDTYGHDVGDKVLKFVASTFTADARPFDLFGRWGGEEFIGIIPNCMELELEQIGNRIRLLIENAYIVHENGELHVTLSTGATMAAGTDTMDSLVKRADSLLYKSKASGRNRVTIG